MKNTITTTLALTSAALFVCASASAVEKTNAVARPLAAFADEPMKGKDPFFPDSTRRLQTVAQPVPITSTNSAPTYAPVAVSISLKGISGTKAQPLALVNNTTLAVGEATEIRAAGQHVKILLREIRERSVLIEIVATGEVRELKLRDGI